MLPVKVYSAEFARILSRFFRTCHLPLQHAFAYCLMTSVPSLLFSDCYTHDKMYVNICRTQPAENCPKLSGDELRLFNINVVLCVDECFLECIYIYTYMCVSVWCMHWCVTCFFFGSGIAADESG